MNWKGLGKKRYYPEIYFEARKKILRTISVPKEIRTENLSNMSQDRYIYTTPFDGKSIIEINFCIYVSFSFMRVSGIYSKHNATFRIVGDKGWSVFGRNKKLCCLCT
jgi:hypothetical protein